jgi:hypothetical protein
MSPNGYGDLWEKKKNEVDMKLNFSRYDMDVEQVNWETRMVVCKMFKQLLKGSGINEKNKYLNKVHSIKYLYDNLYLNYKKSGFISNDLILVSFDEFTKCLLLVYSLQFKEVCRFDEHFSNFKSLQTMSKNIADLQAGEVPFKTSEFRRMLEDEERHQLETYTMTLVLLPNEHDLFDKVRVEEQLLFCELI